ncbi:hypothetical protein H8F22_03660 [Pseudomonas sp. P154a]|uniref:hypothetical protein n=1 Tax=Pseudomonas mucoides TaxID=2730424 RepID=UPI00189208A4|nr:hypothetical protein [Pseudomonas mucoides]MBF6037962.1 hypothetical protein [Pseudomonas mucoides]
MRYLAIFASTLLSANAYSADTLLTNYDSFHKSYSVVSAEGELPIRNVVVKIVGEQFSSYRGFQINCVSRKLSDTGFYSTPDAARRQLPALDSAEKTVKVLTDEVWAAACEAEQPTLVNDSVQPPKAS